MNIEIKLTIGLSPELSGFLTRFLGASSAPTTPQRVHAPEPEQVEPEENMHTRYPATEYWDGPPKVTEGEERPPPVKRRGRPPKSEAIDAAQAEPGATSSESNKLDQPSSGSPEVPTDDGQSISSTEETLAEALGIDDGEAPTQKALDDKLKEVVDKNGNIRLIQNTLFEATGLKSIKDMPDNLRAKAIDALDGLLAA